MKENKGGWFGVRGSFWLAPIIVIAIILIVVFTRTKSGDKQIPTLTVAAPEAKEFLAPPVGTLDKTSGVTSVIPESSVIPEVKPSDDQRSVTEKDLNRLGLTLKNSVRVSVVNNKK